MSAKPKSASDATGQLAYIPLADLRLSPMNARQAVPQADVDARAGSIAQAGLLQNLIGWRNSDGIMEIVAGGTRLRALQQLAAQGFVPAPGHVFDPVPVLVMPTLDDAIRAALVENEARKNPHPADCIVAYRQMHATGASVSAIAAANAVSESTVSRYLALAGLPDAAIDALRAGRLSVDQARALTLASTPEIAAETLQAILERGLSPYEIRRDLTTGRIPARDTRVQFVGLDAYLAAGGSHQRDLFEDTAYLTDAALLDRLVAEKAAAMVADLITVQGWKWAEFRPEFESWESLKGAKQLHKQVLELPAGDQQRLEELEERHPRDLSDDERRERDAFYARQTVWTDDQRASSGVIVSLTMAPTFTSCGWQRAADAPQATVTHTADDGTVTTTRKPAADAAPSQSLADDLGRIRLLSLQNAALENPSLLISVLAFQMTHPHHAYDAALAITTSPPFNTPERPEGTTVPARLQAGTDAFQPTDPAAFTAFAALPMPEQLDRLGQALARLLRQGSALEPLLADATAPFPRDLWHPTAAGYLGRLTVTALDAIWAELIPQDDYLADAHAAFAAMKKRDKAAHLDRLFNDLSLREDLGLSRDQNARIDTWLPAELQWDLSPDGAANTPAQQFPTPEVAA